MKLYLLAAFLLLTNITAAQTITDSTAASNLEVDAEYPGGVAIFNQYINSKIIYPQNALKNKIEGEVDVSFVIERDGTLTDIKIIKSPSIDLSNEASRILGLSLHWRAAISNKGKPMRREFATTINFELNKAFNESKASSAEIRNRKIRTFDLLPKRAVIVEPQFPGGIPAFYEHINKSLLYQNNNQTNNKKGSALARFTVEADGTLTGIELTNGISEKVDKQVIEAISTCLKWNPIIKDGVPIRSLYTIIVFFKY